MLRWKDKPRKRSSRSLFSIVYAPKHKQPKNESPANHDSKEDPRKARFLSSPEKTNVCKQEDPLHTQTSR